MSYLIKIIVRFKNAKTAEAQEIQRVIERLDVKGVDVDCAKYYELKIEAQSREEALSKAKIIVDKVLVNPIIEEFEIQEVVACE